MRKMQTSKAKELQKQWGDKPCNHPELAKEYYLGSDTGDYVCTTCGEIGSLEYFEILKNKE